MIQDQVAPEGVEPSPYRLKGGYAAGLRHRALSGPAGT